MDIPGYEGRYQASNMGRIRRILKNGYRIFKNKINKKGYKIAHLTNASGKDKNIAVHRCVAKTFIPNPYNLPEVNHKNEIKTDNNIYNLEWCTSKYNNNYGSRKEKAIKTRIANSGKYAGVSYRKDRKYYCLETTYKNVRLRWGGYNDKDVALQDLIFCRELIDMGIEPCREMFDVKRKVDEPILR